jgi:hypothetical protein
MTRLSKIVILFSAKNVLEEALSSTSKGDFMYKEVSEISDLTEESFPEGVQMLRDGAKDLENYDKLMEQTKKKLRILDGRLQEYETL